MSEAQNIVQFPSNETIEGVLVQISIRQWKGLKIDRLVTDEVAIDKTGSCANVGAYQKRLFSKKSLKHISKTASDARSLNYLMTLPWSDTGQRLLPAPQVFLFSDRMKGLKQKFEAEVEHFLKTYARSIRASKTRLGAMFDPDDYPSEDDVRSKFSFNYFFSEVPTGDLRISMSEEDKEKFRQQVIADNDERLFAGVEAYIVKLAERLTHYRDKICGEREDGKASLFRDSSLNSLKGETNESVGAVAAMVRAMNLTHDHRLLAVVDDIEKLACEINTPHHAETVRNSANAREKGRNKADDILKKMGFS